MHLRDVRLGGLALLVGLAFAYAQLIALDVGWLRRLELVALDEQFRLRGTRAPGPDIVLVMIDDESLAELGRWPVPRTQLAGAVDVLRRAGAKTIGIDILFADPEAATARSGTGLSPGDAALAAAIGEAGNVVLPFAFRFGAPAPEAGGERPQPYRRLSQSTVYRPLALSPSGLLTPLAPIGAHAMLGHTVVAYDVDGPRASTIRRWNSISIITLRWPCA